MNYNQRTRPRDHDDMVFNIKYKNKIKLSYKVNRDVVENSYLRNRIGSYNKPAEQALLNNPDPKSSIFLHENERFNKDFALNEYDRRLRENERKKNRYENLKNILFDRERKRWEKMDYDYLKNENKIIMNKEKNIVGRKNNPGYNFLKIVQFNKFDKNNLIIILYSFI